MTLISLINKCFLYVIKNIEKDIDAHYDLLSLIDWYDQRNLLDCMFLNCSITENNPYIYLEMSTVPTPTVPFHTKLWESNITFLGNFFSTVDGIDMICIEQCKKNTVGLDTWL